MLKKLIAMTIVTTMLLSSFCIIAQAEYEYNYLDIVSKELAATASGSWDDDSADSKKRTLMVGTDNSTEIATSYWRLFNNNEATDSFIRLNGSSSYASKVVEGKNQVYRFNGHDVADYTFYSTKSGLTPRIEILDINSKSGANINTASSKNKASTLTYEFDLKCDYNFIDMSFYIATQFNGSDTNKDIEAIKIDSNGKLYSTTKSLITNPVDTGIILQKGVNYKIGIVIKLIPTEAANTYDYTIAVYVNGNNIYNAESTKRVTAGKVSYYGMEISPIPWTEKAFNYSTSAYTASDAKYTAKTSLSSNGVGFSSSVTTEYTIIDTDVVIGNFYVYAGDKYSANKPALNGKDTDFYITSNVRNNTNYVTVAAQTAADDATGNGTIVLATYNNKDELISITTAPMTLTAGAITEQDIDISTASADETKLFIINNTSAMTPLAASTALN